MIIGKLTQRGEFARIFRTFALTGYLEHFCLGTHNWYKHVLLQDEVFKNWNSSGFGVVFFFDFLFVKNSQKHT